MDMTEVTLNQVLSMKITKGILGIRRKQLYALREEDFYRKLHISNDQQTVDLNM